MMRAALLALAPLLVAAAAPAPAAWRDPGLPVAAPPIDADELSAAVRTLSSDAFGGRSPGTPGEQRTVAYLVARLKALGLQPAGPDGSWTQAVPMIHAIAGTPAALSVAVAGKAVPVAVGADIAPGTARATDRVRLANAPLVFVGYGVSAPDRGWNDFKGVDLRGKVAVFLVNDPDVYAKPGEDAFGKFDGKAMTYFGRWTYKYEEAARRGAIGALIIHDPVAAGYGWNVAGNTVGGVYALPVEPGQPQPVAVQSWISGAFADRLFKAAGLDLASLAVQARSKAFRPVPLKGSAFSIDLPVTAERIESRNVLAKVPGTAHPDETVFYGAHWDAYGIGAPDAQGRTIRPGANDDGLGVAALLAIARRTTGTAPERTVAFAFWTGEERGLLGSEWYARHPVFPIATTVAALTIDILQTAGPSRDVVEIGYGKDSLDRDLAAAAAKQGRTVTPDAKPERGLFYRADHFSLAKRGVPTLLLMGAGGGVDLVDGGRAAGDKWVSDYTAHCYHQTCDIWSPDWDLRGAAADIDLFATVGATLANSREWPTWNATSEFRAIRETSAALRGGS